MDDKYGVYVQADNVGRITSVNSDVFLKNTDCWIKIDEGAGDKYAHAQGNYFPMPIYDDRGIKRYKLEDGKPVERTQEEMDADYAEIPPPPPSEAQRIAALEAQLAAYEAAYTEGVNEA